MGTEYAGELVIEWPGPGEFRGEFRSPVAGWQIAPMEHRAGREPKLLENVTALTVHATVKDPVTATMTRSWPSGDPDDPFREEESTWLVVGCRVRAAP